MRIWFDTEFIEDGRTIDLISIGLVREDGNYYYAINKECDYSKASAWVAKNVLPRLGSGSYFKRAEIAADIIKFAGEKPEFWAYYADYDWVALCQLYGMMIDLPKGWPMFCMDVKQLAVMLGNPKLPKQSDESEHNALEDARWTMGAWQYLQSLTVP